MSAIIKMKTAFIIFPIMILAFFAGCVQTQVTPEASAPEGRAVVDYDPRIDPADFVSGVTNKYFTLTPGKNFVYEADTEDGKERTEVVTTEEKRMVLGVETTVVWDRVWLNDELIEETKDWYAQDKEGNVWYFGEDSKEMIGGKVIGTAGSWEAGVDGAKPGIIMKADPQAGDSYRQEYYAGEAEDMAEVLAIGETVTVPYGTFGNCLKTRDWTPLEPGVYEHKYYCPAVGNVVLEVSPEDRERVELVEIKTVSEEKAVQAPAEELKTQITEDEAKEIALKRISGKVTDVAIERKFGKLAYVVEIKPNYGPETDVIIDVDTGEILAVES